MADKINYTGSDKWKQKATELLNEDASTSDFTGATQSSAGTHGLVPAPASGSQDKFLKADGTWDIPSGGTDNYNDLTNKPSINNVALSGNKSLSDLGINIPTQTSELTNNSGFITNTVNNLTNYYLKSQTYTQAEVNALIGAISTLHIEIVQALPTQDISNNTIYFVPKQSTGTDDIYDEYIYVNNSWELIGTTQIDLSSYVTLTQLSTTLADYVTITALSTALANYYTKTQIDSALNDKVSKSGDTMSGALNINGTSANTLDNMSYLRNITGINNDEVKWYSVLQTNINDMYQLTGQNIAYINSPLKVNGFFDANSINGKYMSSDNGTFCEIETNNITLYGSTANRALVTNADKEVVSSAVTDTELGYLSGVTSAIQTQLGNKAPKSHASSATTYGAGTASNYGHVKLTDTYATVSASQKAANSIAASAWALQSAYSALNSSKITASVNQLPSGANLNNYRTLFAQYGRGDDATVATFSNCPTTHAFWMAILPLDNSSGFCIQLLIDYVGGIWMRAYTHWNSSWNKWVSH